MLFYIYRVLLHPSSKIFTFQLISRSDEETEAHKVGDLFKVTYLAASR